MLPCLASASYDVFYDNFLSQFDVKHDEQDPK